MDRFSFLSQELPDPSSPRGLYILRGPCLVTLGLGGTKDALIEGELIIQLID